MYPSKCSDLLCRLLRVRVDEVEDLGVVDCAGLVQVVRGTPVAGQHVVSHHQQVRLLEIILH